MNGKNARIVNKAHESEVKECWIAIWIFKLLFHLLLKAISKERKGNEMKNL